MTRSFRMQLAVRATAAVATGAAALSLVTILTLRGVLDREVDASILNIASIQAASLADGPTGSMHFHEWDLTPDEASSVRDLVQYAQVWDAEGVSLLRSQYMTADLPTDTSALRTTAEGELVWTNQNFEGVAVRTVFYPLERLGAAHQAHVLQVAAPLTRRNGMLRRSAAFLILLSFTLAGATFAGSWWLAGSAVRPIHEVIDQAEDIGARSLDRRIQAYADTIEYTRLVEVLNTMLARLQSAFDAQRRFTADASHELRSPLTAMRGEIEVTLKRDRKPEEYVEVLGSSLEEVVRLSKISEDLLTLARTDSQMLKPELELFNVGQIASGVVQRLGSAADARGVAVRVQPDEPITAEVDAGMFGQIVWNLVDNAIRHTPSGGRVSVTLGHRGDSLALTVDDTGQGLGPLDAETVFERFTRGDAARTYESGAGGTGLGLSIVRALSEAHGGEVHAENRAGGGARFTVELPKAGV
ncbi:MAG: sensor histidine kinase [Longimicrobiales bacterium]